MGGAPRVQTVDATTRDVGGVFDRAAASDDQVGVSEQGRPGLRLVVSRLVEQGPDAALGALDDARAATLAFVEAVGRVS